MTAGLLIYDAIDTGLFLIDVIWLWCLTAAAIITALVALTAVTVRAAWLAVRNGLAAAQAAVQHFGAPQRPPTPHTPAWAHTETETA